ncbi:hypothetical protein BSKO_06657 [Bryopsis sp. KO-2023]|nr:hypothetical protein BSKO_06657 [Bryopsis sp. KO-2023]
MSFIPFTVAAIAIGVVAVIFDVVQVPLPYPAFQFVVSDIRPDLIPIEPSPLEGVYSPNTALQSSKLVLKGAAFGVETVAVSEDGKTVYLPDKFGNLIQGKVVDDGDSGLEIKVDPVQPVLTFLGAGRPLGAMVDRNGDVIVCDSVKGLLKVEVSSGRIEILANRVSDNSPKDPRTTITYANDLDIARDGTIYFTDSSKVPVALGYGGWYDTLESFMLTVFEGRSTGRLLSYNPLTRETYVVSPGFWFANGVALSRDETFVAVVETVSLRVYKCYIKGPHAGTRHLLIDSLPGFPDGIARSSDGNFWVSIVAPPSPILKLLPYKPLRALIAYLPSFLRPTVQSWGFVLKIDGEGKVLEKLMDPDGAFISHISAVQEADGKLFMGNLVGDYVSIFDLGVLKNRD